MDPMTMAALASAGSSILGGVLGNEAARKDRRAARNAMQQALAGFSNINLPDIEQQKLLFEELQNAGQLTPELEQAILLGPSAQEQVSADPRLKAQQMKALEQLAGVAESGMTPADQAAFELARRNAATENQAMQGQILQQMQARGQGGSGAELIARLKGAQSSANALQDAQLKEAVARQQARQQAIGQVGDMSTRVRQQDVGEQSDIARARDLVNQFNAQQQTQAQRANVGARNLAQQQNLQNQQRLLDANAALRNQQQQFNKGLLQQQFGNQMQMAQARAGALTGQSQFLQNQAANTAGGMAQMGQGVGSMLAAFANRPSQPATPAPQASPVAMNFDPTKFGNIG